MRNHSTAASPSVAYSYIRFSTPDQAKGDSLRRQTEAAADWCVRNGANLDNTTTLHDLGKSAFTGTHRKNPDRHALAGFLRLVEQGKVPRGSFLVIENLDRLSREHIRPALTLLLNLIEAGIRVVQLRPVEQVYDEDVEPMALMMAIMELSRGHGESKIKSERLGRAWRHKKECAREGKPQPSRKTDRGNSLVVLTHCLPSWIEERGGKPVLVPEKAAVVKRIFLLAAGGYGSRMIARTLTKDGVPPITRAKHWNSTYVRFILVDQRAMGVYQPKRNRGRELDGEPIPNYFPPVVTEREWLAAQEGIALRRSKPGRVASHVNVFAGLLKNARDGESYHCILRKPSHGRGSTGHVLRTGAVNQGRGACLSFPLATFEKAIFSKLREIDPHDILNGDHPPDDTILLGAEETRLKESIAKIDADLSANGYSKTLADQVRREEARLADTVRKLNEARQRASHPVSESWGEAQTLMGVLDGAADPSDARLRLRAALRRIVDSIWLLVVPRRRDRLCAVQIWFKDGKKHRDYVILHQPMKANTMMRIECMAWADSIADTLASESQSEFDFRSPDDLSEVETVLSSADLEGLKGRMRKIETN